MLYNLIIKEEAHYDTIEAYLYYEERRDGLGEKFLNALNQRYEEIVQNPQFYSFISADKQRIFRDVKIKGFPYVVIYEFTENEVTVYAVHNCSKYRKDYFE